MKRESDEDLSEELNDKLNELWTDAAQKRRELMRSKLPDYSRIADSTSGLAEKQLLNLREQLQQEVSSSKHKDLEIQNLKLVASQLANEKKYLISELEQSRTNTNENCPHLLNQSSIGNVYQNHYESSIKKLRNKSEKKEKKRENPQLEDISKQRLLELLRSTSEYRSFVFYYDSKELSYLKRLQMQHKKNCAQPASEKERNYWAPVEVVEKIQNLNKAYNLQLSTLKQQKLISRIKGFYEHNLEYRLRKLKNNYEQKLRSTMRSGQSEVPYDLVQICRARERQIDRIVRRRTNTLTK